MNRVAINRKFLLFHLLLISIVFSAAHPVLAFEREHIKNFITFTFLDNGPVTTQIDVRLSLWRLGDPESNEIDGNGAIVTSDPDYGNWQMLGSFTPAADGTVGVNMLNTTLFPTWPEIYDHNAYLQVEFKYPGEPDAAYRMVDMLADQPDFIKRFLLVDSLSSLNPVMILGGTPNNDFILDVNYNAPQFIRLIFGENAKALAYDLISNWFNLDARLNINGFTGIKFAVNAHADDSETQLLSVRNSSGTAVYYVDEDGDVTSSTITTNSSLTLPAGSGTPSPILKHLSVTAANVNSANIAAAGCGDYATITVNGAVVGDTVIATPTAVSGGIETVSLSWNSLVSSANQVLIRACNPLTSTAINTADTQTWRVDVWGH